MMSCKHDASPPAHAGARIAGVDEQVLLNAASAMDARTKSTANDFLLADLPQQQCGAIKA
ncbi:MAG TPA: hypothetical protein VNQ56_16735 [Pseudolabrys sp.]|nr:hypothetical protein [Pseudolabrys sp.]